MPKLLWQLLVILCSSLNLYAANLSIYDQNSLITIEPFLAIEHTNEAITPIKLPSFEDFYRPFLLDTSYFANICMPISSFIPNTPILAPPQKNLKRKRDDYNNDDGCPKKPRMKLINNIACKSPVMLALLHGVHEKQGSEFIDLENGIIKITDFKKLLIYIEKNIKKPGATQDHSFRIKAIAQWYSGLPPKQYWFKQTFELTLRQEKMVSYRKLFHIP